MLEFNPGDRVACLFASDSEYRAVISDLVRKGLERKEKVFLTTASGDFPAVKQPHPGQAFDPEPYIETGALIVYETDQVFCNGTEGPEAFADLIREEAEKAASEDYKCRRVVLDMSRVSDEGLSNALNEIEILLDRMARNSGCIVICLYDLRQFQQDELLEILKHHALVQIGSNLSECSLYTGSDESGTQAEIDPMLASLLGGLIESAKNQTELFEQERCFRRLIDAAFEGFILHSGGRVFEVSPSLAEFIGLDRSMIEKAVGVDLFDFIPQEYQKIIRQVIKSATSQTNVIEGTGPNGFEYHLEVCGISARYKGNKVRITAIRDIADRKKAEEELKKSEAEINSIISSLHETVIAVISRDGTFLSVRGPDALAERYGLRPEALEGTKLRDFLNEEIADEKMEILEQVCRTGIPNRELFELETSQGSFWMDISLSPLRDPNGMVRVAVLVARDVTCLEQAQEEVRKKNVELGAALAVRNEFLSMVSHELRTPLVPIMGYADMLLSGSHGELPVAYKEPLQTIKSRAEALNMLIDDLLLLSRMEQSDLRTEPQSFPIFGFIEGMLKTYREIYQGKPIEISCTGEEFGIVADPMRLHQVIQNLISNAIKYSSERAEIEIKVSIRDGHGVITIADHGIGIAPEHLEHIFDPFYQIEDIDTREHEGTGLGLAIAKRILDLMDGAISVESKLGIGSTFTVTLPLAETAKAGSEQYKYDRHQDAECKLVAVLVIDEDPAVAESLRDSVGDRYNILSAKSGTEGLEIIRMNRVDLILLDWEPRGTDGLSLMMALKSNTETRGIPVAFLSHKNERDDIEQALSAGAADFIPKTAQRQEMLDRLEKMGAGSE